MKSLLNKRTPFLYPPTQLADLAVSRPRIIPKTAAGQIADSQPQPQPQPNRVVLYLRRAKLIDAIRLHLRINPFTAPTHLIPSLDSFVAVHSIRSCPTPESALFLFQTLKSISASIPATQNSQTTVLSKEVVHAIAKRLSLASRCSDLQELIDSMESGEFPGVLPPAPMDLLRWHATAGDLHSSVAIFDRICMDATGKNLRHPCTESYNLMMDLYAKTGQDSSAVSLFLQMIDEGAIPNSRTYTIVIEHLINTGKLDAAMAVFAKLPYMRIRRTSRQYMVLIDAFSSIQCFDIVKKLLSEMQNDGILPGRSLHLAVLKLQEAGFVIETEDLLLEFEPDGRIGNVGGFLISNGDDEDDQDEKEEMEDEENESAGRKGTSSEIQLKPWLDPSALASSLKSWGPDDVLVLEDAGFIWTRRLVCKLLRAFRNSDAAWQFFCWVARQPGGFVHDVYTISRMIALLARDGCVEHVNRLISKIKQEGIHLSFSTLSQVIDLYGLSKDANAAIGIFQQAEGICGKLSKFHLTLLYSSLLRTLVKCGRSSDAMNYLNEMVLLGIVPDNQTFCGLMQFFALEGDPRVVQQLFAMVRQCRIEPDAYMYQILIRAYCKKKRPALALRVFDDMWIRGLKPDVVSKELLVKSLWKDGRLREAARIEELCEEVDGDLPIAVPGHVWTVSFNDLKQVRRIYSCCFLADGSDDLQVVPNHAL